MGMSIKGASDGLIVLSKSLPQVSNLLEVTGTKNLILKRVCDNLFRAHDNNLTFLHWSNNTSLGEVFKGDSRVIFFRQANMSYRVLLYAPNKYILSSDGDWMDCTNVDSFKHFVLLLKDLCHTNVLADVLKLGGFKKETTAEDLGEDSQALYADFLSTIDKNSDIVLGLRNEAIKASKPVPIETSHLNDAQLKIAKLLDLGNNNRTDLLTPVLTKINQQEKVIDLLAEQIKKLEIIKDKYVQKHIKTLYGNAAMVDKISKIPNDLLDNTGNYHITVDRNVLTINVKNVILSCATTSLSRSERTNYEIPRGAVNVFWPLGDIQVVITFDNREIHVSYEGATAENGHHPHIHGSRLCDDPRVITTVNTYTANGDLTALCKFLRQFLSVYNPSSPHGQQRPHHHKLNHFYSHKEASEYAEKRTLQQINS